MQEFNYDIAKLKNRIQFESMQKAKNIRSESGESQVDHVSINDKDLIFIGKLLETAAITVYSVLEPYAHTLEADFDVLPYEFNVTYDAIPGQIVYRVVWPDTFPVTAVSLIDNSIENYLIDTCKSQFLSKSGIDNRQEKEDSERDYSNLLTYINRRNGLKRTYKLF